MRNTKPEALNPGSRVHVTFSILDKHDKTLRRLLDFGLRV